MRARGKLNILLLSDFTQPTSSEWPHTAGRGHARTASRVAPTMDCIDRTSCDAWGYKTPSPSYSTYPNGGRPGAARLRLPGNVHRATVVVGPVSPTVGSARNGGCLAASHRSPQMGIRPPLVRRGCRGKAGWLGSPAFVLQPILAPPGSPGGRRGAL